ncbi:MAG TPA: Crp/Fnr family transcriptional regulator [Terracidiphilus sp.]|jgi:CRP-like cAMP-binding protein|nr:Crp/Fnr family transcriptional regulator [Terracidiphilus sp.]
MQSEAKPEVGEATPRPLAELLSCPPATADLLNVTAQYIEFASGNIVFRQGAACRGLYVVASGQLQRRADRFQARLVLGSVHPGELVELAAALGNGQHTYSLVAQSPASLMMLPMDSLNQAFDIYPPLRMQLLEELAREVSRAYLSCCAARNAGMRRRTTKMSVTQSTAI